MFLWNRSNSGFVKILSKLRDLFFNKVEKEKFRISIPFQPGNLIARRKLCHFSWENLFSIDLNNEWWIQEMFCNWNNSMFLSLSIVVFLIPLSVYSWYLNIQKATNQLIQKIKCQKRNLLGEKRHDFLLEAYRKDFEFAESIKLPTAKFSYNHPLGLFASNRGSQSLKSAIWSL